MNRQTAICLSLIFFIIFALLGYYGCSITAWAAVTFATLVSFLLLNLFYSPGNIATDDPDFTIGVYIIMELIAFVILGIYVVFSTLSSKR